MLVCFIHCCNDCCYRRTHESLAIKPMEKKKIQKAKSRLFFKVSKELTYSILFVKYVLNFKQGKYFIPVPHYHGIFFLSFFSLLAEFELISCLLMSCLPAGNYNFYCFPNIPVQTVLSNTLIIRICSVCCLVEYVVRKQCLVDLKKENQAINFYSLPSQYFQQLLLRLESWSAHMGNESRLTYQFRTMNFVSGYKREEIVSHLCFMTSLF